MAAANIVHKAGDLAVTRFRRHDHGLGVFFLRDIAGDVSKEEDAQAMVVAAEARYGKVTGLVNNVGGGHPGTVVEIAEEDWDRVVEINLKTAMQGTKVAIPAMLRAASPEWRPWCPASPS